MNNVSETIFKRQNYNYLYQLLPFFVRMNYTECFPLRILTNGSDDNYMSMIISTGTAVGVSVFVYIMAVVLIVALRLHTKLVYRLAVYQISSSILFLIVWEVYLTSKIDSAVTRLGRYSVDTVVTFSAYVYQILCTWIVVHQFALAVCYKNLNRLEPLYVVSSLLVSSVMAVVSFALVFVATSETHSSDCSAYDVFIIKRWIEGIFACVLIGLNCALVIVIGLVLCHRAYRKRNGHRSLSDQQHKKALCEMLPLLMYPVFSVMTPVMYAVMNHFDHALDYRSRFVVPMLTFTWSMMFALSIISHLGVVICIRRRNASRHAALSSINKMEESGTVHESSHILARSNTYYSIPEDTCA